MSMHRVAGLEESISPVEARVRYAAAWKDYRGERNHGIQRRLEKVMDSLQNHITHGNNSAWQFFVDSLPGFRDHWGDLHNQTLKDMYR